VGFRQNERGHMTATRLYMLGVVLLLAFSGACGYKMAHFDNPALEGLTTIAIPYFENKTYEPGVESVFTYAFINKFIETGRLQVVSVDEADLILRGEIRKVDFHSLALSPDKRALEWRVWTTIRVAIEERTTGRVLWKREKLRHGEEYRSSGMITITEDQDGQELEEEDFYFQLGQLEEADKRRAFRGLAADMAEQVHDGLLQGF